MTAVKEAIEKIPGKPTVLAAGIDAPMFWSRCGWNRKVDDILRQTLEDGGFPEKCIKSVMHINGIYGAALVQGMLLGKYLREDEEWEDLKITESHPTVLRCLLKFSRQSRMVRSGLKKFGMVEVVQQTIAKPVTHEQDATRSALSAWAMLQEPPGWQNLYIKEPSPIQPFNTPVSYWMPISPND